MGKHFYAAIYGAGIAGCAITAQLAEQNKLVLWMDPRYRRNHTPGPPAALVNPATGRHARPSWEAENCYYTLRRRISQLSEYLGQNEIISDSGVLRPAINEDLAASFRKALTDHKWPEGWISWIGPARAAEMADGLAESLGALHLPVGFTVYVERYLNIYREYLTQLGVDTRAEVASYSARESGGFDLTMSDGSTATCDHIIVAAGAWTTDFPEYSSIPLHKVKGEICVYESETDLEWNCAVSASGYILREGMRRIIVGSTYEHKEIDLKSTNRAARQLRAKLEQLFPGFENEARMVSQHAGIRMNTSNRLPVIGELPEHPGMWVYSGLGSKGLLFSEYVASLLAEKMIHNKSIPDDLDILRYSEVGAVGS